MNRRNQSHQRSKQRNGSSTLPTETVLNAYEIEFPQGFAVPVSTYVVQPTSGIEPSHEDRGEVVSAVWDYWRLNKASCSGREYWVIDISADRVAVPAGWALPSTDDFNGYSIVEDASFNAIPGDPEHEAIICGLIRESIKRTLKEYSGDELGPLWRCFGDFCQMPAHQSAGDYQFCRKFTVQPVVLSGGRYVVRIAIHTVCLDGRTLDSYYREAKVEDLAELVEAKRGERTDRKGRPIGVQVWRDLSTSHSSDGELLSLADVDTLLEQRHLSAAEQRRHAAGEIQCDRFMKPPEWIKLSELRLVLNTDITTEQHSETIISPDERLRLEARMRQAIDGLTVVGRTLHLKSEPIKASDFVLTHVRPPSVRVKDEWGNIRSVDSSARVDFESLKDRARRRCLVIERHGFVHSHAINPALAWPVKLPETRARRMESDLNYILRKRNIEQQFQLIRYRDVADLESKLAHGGYDAVMVVLPEHSSKPYLGRDTHEQLKQRLEIPSKCIHFDNTLPEDLVAVRPSQFNEGQRRVAKRVRGQYRLTLDHLLIKHGWMPFEPNEAFKFNVQVGLDVGGQRNDTVVACLGYGFAELDTPFSFHMHRIPVPTGNAEPIPTTELAQGLINLFESVLGKADASGIQISLDSVLFIRDGAMLGDGDRWNEYEALEMLLNSMQEKGRVSAGAQWAVAEIHKRAEFWRMYDVQGRTVFNPLVGRCVQLGDSNEALLATTGRPYLSRGQGSAQLLKVVGRNLCGDVVFSDIIQDVAWGADMGLTQPGMGRSLPWVLHGADAGALQASRGYKLLGVNA